MKKLLLTVSLLLVFCGIAKSQNESAIASENAFLASANLGNVVRNWGDSMSISVHLIFDSGSVFAMTPFAMQCASTGAMPTFNARITKEVPNIVVNDMRIVDHTAYFCGSFVDTTLPLIHPLRTKGIIGCVDLFDFQSSMLQIKIFSFDSIRRFMRMLAYDGLAGPKVVALGERRVLSSSPTVYKSAVAEYDIVSNPTLCNIYVADGESMYDLVLSEEKVVVVGYNHTANDIIALHRADRNNVVLDLFSTDEFLYTPGNWEVNLGMYASYLGNNHFAVSYVHHSSDNKFYTRIRVFDIPTMANINSQQFMMYQKYEPTETAFDPKNKTLIMIHEMPLPIIPADLDYRYFIHLDPYSTVPYTANVLLPKKHFYYSSLDIFRNSHYVAIGGNRWYYQHVTAPQPNINGCPSLKNIYVEPIQNLDYYPSFLSSMEPLNPSSFDKQPIVNSTTIYLECKDE